MKRKKLKDLRAPDAILSSDWHLREDVPRCRVDDFWSAQWNKVDEVSALQAKYKCPVIHAGDLYHHWKPSPYLLAKSIQHLPRQFYTIYGQHDLPQHNMELSHKSGIHALSVANALTVIPGSWGDPGPGRFDVKHRKIGVWHKFVWDGKKIPWPDCEELTSREILRKFKEFDLIVTGDHHRPFITNGSKNLLVNCGCLTRQDASYIKHQARVWLYYADNNTVEPHFLKYNPDAVSREHLEKSKLREERISAFVSRLTGAWDIDASFEGNIDRALKSEKVKKSVKELIYKAIE